MYLGHIGLQEQFQVFGDNPLGYSVNILQSISGRLEREEPNQADNLTNN